MSAEPMLYGESDAEYLHLTIDAAVETWFAHCNLEHNDERLPYTVTFYEHTVLPLGDSGAGTVMAANEIAEMVAERFCDDAGFEEMAEQYMDIAGDPDVVAAFEVARALMVSKQVFRVADKTVRKVAVTFTAIAEDRTPTTQPGEWAPA